MLSLTRIAEIYYRWGRKVGIKENLLALLYALSDGGHYTQKQICEEWLIPKTTINTLIKELEKLSTAPAEVQKKNSGTA